MQTAEVLLTLHWVKGVSMGCSGKLKMKGVSLLLRGNKLLLNLLLGHKCPFEHEKADEGLWKLFKMEMRCFPQVMKSFKLLSHCFKLKHAELFLFSVATTVKWPITLLKFYISLPFFFFFTVFNFTVQPFQNIIWKEFI